MNEIPDAEVEVVKPKRNIAEQMKNLGIGSEVLDTVELQAKEDRGSHEKPIILKQSQIQKLVKMGLLIRKPSKPLDVGVITDTRIFPGTSIPVNNDTWVTHPDSEEEIKKKIIEQGFPLRVMSRQERRNLKSVVDGVIQAAYRKQEVDKIKSLMQGVKDVTEGTQNLIKDVDEIQEQVNQIKEPPEQKW